MPPRGVAPDYHGAWSRRILPRIGVSAWPGRGFTKRQPSWWRTCARIARWSACARPKWRPRPGVSSRRFRATCSTPSSAIPTRRCSPALRRGGIPAFDVASPAEVALIGSSSAPRPRSTSIIRSKPGPRFVRPMEPTASAPSSSTARRNWTRWPRRPDRKPPCRCASPRHGAPVPANTCRPSSVPRSGRRQTCCAGRPRGACDRPRLSRRLPMPRARRLRCGHRPGGPSSRCRRGSGGVSERGRRLPGGVWGDGGLGAAPGGLHRRHRAVSGAVRLPAASVRARPGAGGGRLLDPGPGAIAQAGDAVHQRRHLWRPVRAGVPELAGTDAGAAFRRPGSGPAGGLHPLWADPAIRWTYCPGSGTCPRA